ncbi:hypothetical protein EDB84DRAFT_1680967 [Lactarius hengduanensis]|nr:hypothetical protein EDB84DRAFT_1680967 [Lactarius hengduanensis]
MVATKLLIGRPRRLSLVVWTTQGREVHSGHPPNTPTRTTRFLLPSSHVQIRSCSTHDDELHDNGASRLLVRVGGDDDSCGDDADEKCDNRRLQPRQPRHDHHDHDHDNHRDHDHNDHNDPQRRNCNDEGMADHSNNNRNDGKAARQSRRRRPQQR